MLADFLIHNTSEVLTRAGPAPRAGPRQSRAGSLAGGAVASRNGTIVFIGADWRRECTLTPDAVALDAEGGAVVPGFVDPHTTSASGSGSSAPGCAGQS